LPAYDPENPLVKKPTNGDNRTLVIEEGRKGRTLNEVEEAGHA